MIRILLVDDQNLVQQGIKLLLEQDDKFKVIGMARDGRSAIRQINFLHPDIVLLDIEIPEMNGISVTKYINHFFPQTKVIILSSHENKKYLIQALVAGAKSYILKNSLMTDLKDAILAVDRGYSQIESRLLAKVLNSGNLKSSSAKSHAANFQNINRHLDKKTTDDRPFHSRSDRHTARQTIDLARVSDFSGIETLKAETACNKNILNQEESLNSICHDNNKDWLKQENNELSKIDLAVVSSVASSASSLDLNSEIIESEQKTKIQSDDGSYSILEDTTEPSKIELKSELIVKAAQSNNYYSDEPSYLEQLYYRLAYGSRCTTGETALVRVSVPASPENEKTDVNYRRWRLSIPVKSYLQQLINRLKIISLKKQIVHFSQQAVILHRSQMCWCFERVKEYKSRLLLLIRQRNVQKLLWNFAFMISGGIIVFILR